MKLLVCFARFFFITNYNRAQPGKAPDLYEQTSEVNNIMVQYHAAYRNLSRVYVTKNSRERRVSKLRRNKAPVPVSQGVKRYVDVFILNISLPRSLLIVVADYCATNISLLWSLT